MNRLRMILLLPLLLIAIWLDARDGWFDSEYEDWQPGL